MCTSCDESGADGHTACHLIAAANRTFLSPSVFFFIAFFLFPLFFSLFFLSGEQGEHLQPGAILQPPTWPPSQQTQCIERILINPHSPCLLSNAIPVQAGMDEAFSYFWLFFFFGMKRTSCLFICRFFFFVSLDVACWLVDERPWRSLLRCSE